MNTDSMVLKEYFTRYLLNIRKVSAASVKHYFDALNNISRRLQEKGVIQDSVFEIYDLNQLYAARDLLLQDVEFVKLDQRGKRMYSAGLNNYIRFAEGADMLSIQAKEKESFDAPIIPEQPVIIQQKQWKRSGILRVQAIQMANYKCELNPGHITFDAEATGKPYMEGHHAVPMNLQEQFTVSLDVYANIVSLCPVCHRKIHLGKRCERMEMAGQIYDVRQRRLSNCGLIMSKQEFIRYAADI